jgi:thiol-disulfide isomerase/thioredoxin
MSKTHIINISIEGKKYDYLCLEGRLLYDRKTHYIEGKSENGYDWVFEIPETAIDSVKFFYFATGKYNPQDTTVFMGVLSINENQTNRLPAHEKNNITYHLKHLKTYILKKEGRLVQDTVYMEKYNLVVDMFEIKNLDSNSELALLSKYPEYGFSVYISDTYDQKIQEFISIAKNYPNSQYLLSSLFDRGHGYIHNRDLDSIFSHFSKTNRQSFFGKQIQEYLHPVFENISLPLVTNFNRTESLITDFTKYNLVELTAWWCGPCRRLLPTLKELGTEYGDKLIITYATIDDESTVGKFQDYVKEENITWRCLWSGRDRDNFVYRLGGRGIPKSILIAPNGDIKYLRLNGEARTGFHATLIGRPTSGALGQVVWIPLQESNAAFSGVGLFSLDGTGLQRKGIIPDMEVYPAIESIKAGKDEILEVAVEYFNNR